VRPPGDSFRRAVTARGGPPPDPVLARHQHAAFREALTAAGAAVLALDADEHHPDACFTQDLAVVLSGHALVCRPALAIRRGEVAGVLPALAGLVASTTALPPGATLEGGDVLRAGDRRLVVGRSTRTNAAGIGALEAFAGPLGWFVGVADVPQGILHLQTGVTVAGGLALGLAEVVGQPAFAGLEPLVLRDVEACNVLAVGSHAITAGRHDAHRALERAGFSVVELDLSAFTRADGGPTCLALIVE
jgi:dimethylargininase